MAQGKAWKQDEVMEQLKQYFLLDYSMAKACELAQFPLPTLKTWLVENPELHLKINAWRGMASAQARSNIVKAIAPQKKKVKTKDKNGKEIEVEITPEPDAELSKWWLERRERKAFSTRSENSHEEVVPVPLDDETIEKLKKYTDDDEDSFDD